MLGGELEKNTGKLLVALGARPHVAFRTRSVEAMRSLVAAGAAILMGKNIVTNEPAIKANLNYQRFDIVDQPVAFAATPGF